MSFFVNTIGRAELRPRRPSTQEVTDMALITCRLCRKIFTAAGGRVCPECQKRLDDLYLDVRNYLRDNPKVAFNVETLADALGADIRDVQGLVDLGYLERDMPRGGELQENDSRQKLAKEFEQSLTQMRAAAAAAAQRKPVSYGQELYSDKGRKK